MSLPPDDAPIYFLHIPRTGGTTLRELLARRFPPDRCFLGGARRRFAEDLAALSAERRARLLFVSGHYDASVGRLLGRAPRIVTLLREPAARLRSHFEIVKRMPEHRLHAEVTAGMPFLEWLDHPQGGMVEENRMAHQIAGLLDGRTETTRSRGSALLVLAREALAEFAFFGVHEAYADSLRLLAHTFGWPPFQTPPRRNPSGAPRLTGDERRAALERNPLDVEVYRFAWRRFRQRLGRLPLPEGESALRWPLRHEASRR